MSGQIMWRVAASMVCMLTSVAINIACHDWLFAILRIPVMRVPYILVLSFGLAVCFFFCISPARTLTAFRLLISGALAGWIIGAMSSFLSNFFLSNGYQRIIESFRMDWLIASYVDIFISFVLGAWLVGAASFYLAWLLLDKMTTIKPE